MFSKFIDVKDTLPIPLSAGMYTIRIDGTVIEQTGDIMEIAFDDHGNKVVWLYLWDGWKHYRLDFLLAITFKPVHIPYGYWKQLTLLYADGNQFNIHPSNLVWKFPLDGIEAKHAKGYYYIPGFTRFVINKEGRVMRYLTMKHLEGTKKESGYVYYTLQSDIGKYTVVGRHRALAITFLDYDNLIDSKDVNHIDATPGNDWLENLEWTTRSDNSLHAYASGLRNDNKTVVVINQLTGEVSEYFSAHECERQLGLKRSVVHYRIKHGKGKVYPPGLSFYYKGEEGLVTDIQTCNKDHYGIPVVMINNETNEMLEFPSIIKCANYLGISKKVIQRRLKFDENPSYKQYTFVKKS